MSAKRKHEQQPETQPETHPDKKLKEETVETKGDKLSDSAKDKVALTQSDCPTLKLIARGKVRDIYEVNDDLLLFVASDRISCFDVVMKNGVPGKGKILTQLSQFWFSLLEAQGCKHHLITSDIDKMPPEVRKYEKDLRGRVMLVKKVKILPVEAIVRGYLTGSGLADYKKTGAVCGIKLPEGLVDCSALENPIFTPSTKAELGTHDMNISKEEAIRIVGKENFSEIEKKAIEIYSIARKYAKSKGIILADTKFEFGVNDAKEIVLADEILTPDSSRFWDDSRYEPGRPQDSLDKQFVRNYLESIKFDKTNSIELPTEIIAKTLNKYIEIFRILTQQEPQL